MKSLLCDFVIDCALTSFGNHAVTQIECLRSPSEQCTNADSFIKPELARPISGLHQIPDATQRDGTPDDTDDINPVVQNPVPRIAVKILLQNAQ